MRRRRSERRKRRDDARKMREDARRMREGGKKMKEESKRTREDKLRKMKKRKTISFEDGTMWSMTLSTQTISQTISEKTLRTPLILLRKKRKRLSNL